MGKLPFVHLNLRINPFGELTQEERAGVAVVDLGELPALLLQERQAIQFVADHGRGKSTHLIKLHQFFKNYPYTQIHCGDKPEVTKNAIHFVDSVENLSKFRRRCLYKKADSIAITTHRDLTRELSTAGFKVHTVHVSLLDDSALQKVFSSRIEFARRGEGDVPTISLASISSLKEIFHDDIRAMESHLYAVFQTLEGVGNVEV